MEQASVKYISCDFVPRWGRNPYHRELIKFLEAEHNVTVHAGRNFKTLSRVVVAHGETPPDIIHLHATSPFSFNPVGFAHYVLFHSRLRRLQRAGVKIVWTIHDVYPHESKWEALDMWSGRSLAQSVDYCIVHSPSALSAICERWKIPRLPRAAIIPHGNYLNVYNNQMSSVVARQKLGIDPNQMVYLFLGLMRPYKGIEVLLDVFSKMALSDAMLLLAGEPVNSAIRQTIENAVSRDSRIKFIPGYVEDGDIQLYMNAADAVVFPYRNSLTSGAVIMAMGFKKACIAPRLGAIKDALDADGAFLFEATSEDALKAALEKAYAAKDRLPAMGEHNYAKCREWSWDKIAARTAEVYLECLAR